jgi:hypothetical protein
MENGRNESSIPGGSVRMLIKVTPSDNAKAWALLVRHSPGMALPDQTFLVSPEAVQTLRKAKVRFSVISSDAGAGSPTGAIAGERI